MKQMVTSTDKASTKARKAEESSLTKRKAEVNKGEKGKPSFLRMLKY